MLLLGLIMQSYCRILVDRSILGFDIDDGSLVCALRKGLFYA